MRRRHRQPRARHGLPRAAPFHNLPPRSGLVTVLGDAQGIARIDTLAAAES
jgi:hypothetical protein